MLGLQFVKREPAGAKRAPSVDRPVKHEPIHDISIDSDDDEDAKPKLPMFSQEVDILDLADSSPPPEFKSEAPAHHPAATAHLDPLPDPPSSDALWASFDEPLLTTTPFTHVDRMEQEAFHKSGKLQAMQAVRESSSWGAATQVKRGLEKAAEDRIEARREERREEVEREREASGSPRKGGNGVGGREAVECPVCGVAFVGSELALNAHVEGHFASGGGVGEERPGKRKKVGKPVMKGEAVKRTPIEGKGGGGGGGAGEGGVGGKATLDGFWKR